MNEYIKDLIATVPLVTTFFASVSILLAVESWRREFVGKRRIELAEEVLAHFYEARATIRYIRSIGGTSDEGTSRVATKPETAKQKNARDRAYVAIERYQANQAVFNRLHAMRFQVMARFGTEAEKPFMDLKRVIGRIMSAANLLGMIYWAHEDWNFRTQEAQDKHYEKSREQETIFWEDENNDPLAPAIESLINEIESAFRPFLEQKSVGSFLFEPLRLWK